MRGIFRKVMMFVLLMPGVCFAYRDSRSMNRDLDLNVLIVEPLRDMIIEILRFIPNLIEAVVIVFIGWIVAKIAQAMITKFLKTVNFDGFAATIGLSSFFEKSSGKDKDSAAVPPHKWFGSLVFWISIAVSFIMALRELRLSVASIRMDSFFNFLLTIFTAVVIFVLGLFMSFVVAKVVKQVAKNTNVDNPDLWALMSRIAILAFTSIVCLLEIGLPVQIMLTAVACVFISCCVVFVISFGVGGIQWAGKVLDKTLENKKKQ